MTAARVLPLPRPAPADCPQWCGAGPLALAPDVRCPHERIEAAVRLWLGRDLSEGISDEDAISLTWHFGAVLGERVLRRC